MDFLREEEEILLVLDPAHAISLGYICFFPPGDPGGLFMNNALCCVFCHLQNFVYVRNMPCNIM